MKLKFKKQAYQTDAVHAVVNCFEGQPKSERTQMVYQIDQGYTKDQQFKDDHGQNILLKENKTTEGFKNSDIKLQPQLIFENIQKVQKIQNIPVSENLHLFKTLRRGEYTPDKAYSDKALKIAPFHLDIEMETGTGKTYCYIKTIFELNRQYGWSKFIVVVPSIAIREGVHKSFEITAEHFLQEYSKKAKYFIYNSKQLHNLESFSSDAGINVMIINVQAFNSTSKDNRRIYDELDDFQSRRPIDVIKANRPILILDEPQKMEGDRTLTSLQEFNALFLLRYSATHKSQHHKVYRLDALDAYNQKLVKKIAVRGISVNGLSGTNAYLYLESIEISKKAPVARLELETKQKNTIKRVIRKIIKGDNLYTLSGELEAYKDRFVVTEIDYLKNTVEFENGAVLHAGELTGDGNESAYRRIQIREAIKSHFQKERQLFTQGIKVLTLFFIDEVAKYRNYEESDEKGEYARIFEDEYDEILTETLEDLFLDREYKDHLLRISKMNTHKGYFSIDKKSSRFVDPSGIRDEADDVDAYDLILKDKERLLSFEEPTRFIFSHSALREGWDNPNVFVICTLKNSDNTISRRQEVGRGLRIAVNRFGERMDDPATVHHTNILTVVASESYQDFVKALQNDISSSLSERPRIANEKYFLGKTINTADGPLELTPQMAKQVYRYLVKNDYTDNDDHITEIYIKAKKDNELVSLPDELQQYQEEIFKLIDTVYTGLEYELQDDRTNKVNPRNKNFEKKEFQALWNSINRKGVYSVQFDTQELVTKSIQALNERLHVASLKYTIISGEQTESINEDDLKDGSSFRVNSSTSAYNTTSIHSMVRYDLIGNIAEKVELTRNTVAKILSSINKEKFELFKINPESFLTEAGRLIQEQKAATVIEHLSYQTLDQSGYPVSVIFTENQINFDFMNAVGPLNNHVYDYVAVDSKNEKHFVQELDVSKEVVVYAKLPKGFAIPTPVGNYNPDWAISFREGSVKHIYFVAETKGSMSSLELREVEKIKIQCARKFFEEINQKISPDNVTYDVVDSFGKLMDIVRA